MTWQTTSTLLEHQKPAVCKLIRSRVGALFMDMGTGKTRTTIEFAKLRQSRIGKVVWFCPVSLKETICYEIKKHTDSDSIYVFDDKTDVDNVPKAFWYIIGIESMSASARIVLTANRLMTTRTFAVVDESSYIKGHNSLRTLRITYLAKNAKYRMILTGTPLSQGVVDLYAQMRFLSPEILGYRSFYSFAANHLEYSEKYPGMIIKAHNIGLLAHKVQPYVYQVTKDECLDLLPKLYDSRYFSMTYEQREYYEQAKWEILMSAPDDEIDSYVIFQLFTVLQQIISGYWNREGKIIEINHMRLSVLRDVLSNIPAEAKVIIWCKYRYSIRQITELLGNEAVLYYGDLSEKERNKELARFRKDKRFLVASMACGGHGLNLTESYYTIFYENCFKYSQRIQAEDRQHRIGQTKRVTYVDLVCRNSIDERIQDALVTKGNVVEEFKRKVEKVKGKKGKGGIKDLVKLL